MRLSLRSTSLLCAVSAVLVGGFAETATSANPMDAIKKATKLEQADGTKELKAFDEARDAAVEAWENVPFHIRKIVLTDDKAVGSGMYKERGSSVYRTGEAINVYLEPVGYAWKDQGNDEFAFGFVADLTIKSAAGEVVLEKKALINGEFKSHKKNMEAYMNASIDIESLPDGAYTLEFVVRDKHSDAVDEVKQDFTFRSK